MRRFLFGVVIASITAAMPAWALGGDREIAQSVMAELQQHKAAGTLKGFEIDLKVEDGVVYLTGKVASQAQKALVLRAAVNEVGQDNLVDELQVPGQSPGVQPVPQAVRTAQPVPQVPQAAAVAQASGTNAALQSSRGDMAITDAVIAQLQQSKASGALRGFELDVSTVNGDVWLRGVVANQSQKDHVIDIVRRTQGVSRVIDDIGVAHNDVQPASTGGLMPAQNAPAPIPQGSSMPVAGGRPVYPGQPQSFAPGGMASTQTEGGYVQGGAQVTVQGTPVAMPGVAATYGAGAPRYDQPYMPSYAWPSYAAYPNYAAVTYPKQYSPSAWPYIGPFYPYPQVPLGWRKVALEWDDGLWYLDFTSK